MLGAMRVPLVNGRVHIVRLVLSRGGAEAYRVRLLSKVAASMRAQVTQQVILVAAQLGQPCFCDG